MPIELVASRALRPAFRKLHAELREHGFSGENIEELLFRDIVPALSEADRDPVWARRTPIMFSEEHPVPELPAVPKPLLILLRTFHESRPVARAELEPILSKMAMDALLESGMVVENGGDLVPRISLTEWEGLLVASEPADRIVAADAVDRPDMGTATTTWLYPKGLEVNQAIDIGTGSGIQALLIRQRYGAEVHAIDLNERAVEFCRFNCALNEIDGVNVSVADHSSLAHEERLLGRTDFLVWNMPQIFRVHESLTWGFPSAEIGERVLKEIYQMIPSLLSSHGMAVLRHESKVPVTSYMKSVLASADFDACQLLYVHEDEATAEQERGQVYESLKDVWNDTLAAFDPAWVYGTAILRRREADAPPAGFVPISWGEALESQVALWEGRWRALPGWKPYRITSAWPPEGAGSR